jgi:acyl-coenzyme A thioesterase PaaI-like protein
LLAPARGERFRFGASVVKAGRTLTVCEARAFAALDGIETMIATMTGTLMALAPRVPAGLRNGVPAAEQPGGH